MHRTPLGIAKRVVLKAYLESDQVTPATGKTIAVKISKNGGSFADPSGGATNATEIANGWYYVDLSTTDLGTAGPLIVRGTEADIDDSEITFEVGLGTEIRRNTDLDDFEFPLFSASDHQLITGRSVTAVRSIDGGSLAACANSVTEVGGGWYKIDLDATDLNGKVIGLKFTAPGADDQAITIITQA